MVFLTSLATPTILGLRPMDFALEDDLNGKCRKIVEI